MIRHDRVHPIPGLNAECRAWCSAEHVWSSRKFFPPPPNYCSIVASLRSKRPSRWRCCSSCRPTFTSLASLHHPRGTAVAQISIAELAARPDRGLLPRFRALALFGRRPPERVLGSSLPATENLHKTGSEQVQQTAFNRPPRRQRQAPWAECRGRAPWPS